MSPCGAGEEGAAQSAGRGTRLIAPVPPAQCWDWAENLWNLGSQQAQALRGNCLNFKTTQLYRNRMPPEQTLEGGQDGLVSSFRDPRKLPLSV